MRSLNGCEPLISRSREAKLIPTCYWEIYKITDQSSLLLHLLTGAVDLISTEEEQFLRRIFENEYIDDIPDELRSILERRGYLSDPKSEQEFIDKLAVQHQEESRRKPIEFFICTTFACPVGCSYCCEGKLAQRAKVAAITLEQIESVFSSIEKIKETQGRPIKEIVLFGGEPMLPITMGAVREILQRAKECGLKVSICTSGIFGSEFTPLFYEFIDTISVVTQNAPRILRNGRASRVVPLVRAAHFA